MSSKEKLKSLIYDDDPSVKDVFVDSVRSCTINGGTVRIEFCTQRSVSSYKSKGSVKVEYTSSRLILSENCAEQLKRVMISVGEAKRNINSSSS